MLPKADKTFLKLLSVVPICYILYGTFWKICTKHQKCVRARYQGYDIKITGSQITLKVKKSCWLDIPVGLMFTFFKAIGSLKTGTFKNSSSAVKLFDPDYLPYCFSVIRLCVDSWGRFNLYVEELLAFINQSKKSYLTWCGKGQLLLWLIYF